MDAQFVLLLFSIAVFAGFFGALVGVGGGIIIVPALSLLFHLPMHQAIAASIVSVIATSIAGALSYVDQKITNVRLGMFLEVSTTIGALIGGVIGVLLSGWVLALIFGAFMAYMTVLTYLRPSHERQMAAGYAPPPADRISRALRLRGSYYDQAAHRTVEYHATKSVKGSFVSLAAGLGSGMLGIGGGVLKVTAMRTFMGIPMKASVATSKFMIGVTAATGAMVYFLAGAVNQAVVAPVALGTMLGATAGSRVLNRLHSHVVERIFIALLVYASYEMIAKGLADGFALHLPGLL